MKSVRIKDKRIIWILLGSLAILVRFVLGLFPSITETYYSRGLFKFIRIGIDYGVAWLPIPLIYLFVPLLLFFIVRKFIRLKKRKTSFLKKILDLIYSSFAFVGAIVFFFLILWGFNYARIPIEKQINIKPSPLKLSDIKEDLDKTTLSIVKYRKEINKATNQAIDDFFIPKNFENEIRKDVIKLLQKLDFPTPGHLRGISLKPKGIILRISTSGFYFPWLGECHIDDGLHALQKPFVMAHEFMHGYGFTDEGTCNFLAYLACQQSEDSFVKYSGTLNYWRYLARTYKSQKREDYMSFRKTLPIGIINDLNAINKNMELYPDILPRLRNLAYDSFLKAQGISEGIKNYNRIILLVHAWEAKHSISD